MDSAAVIGAGVSGLTAAHLLCRRYEVTLFEAEPRAGGHAHTHDVPVPEGGTLPVDTGFMVFNRHNYPQLMQLFRELGVQTQGSEMSMSLTCEGCALAYLSGSVLRTMPEPPASVAPERWEQFAKEAQRFSRIARSVAADDDDSDVSLGELFDASQCPPDFSDHMVLPLVSALWSCGPTTARAYPARFLFRFLDHHGLLPGGPPVRWRTVKGGSRTYVHRIVERLPEVLLDMPVRSVRRVTDGVEVRTAEDRVRRFDRVVVAVHADQALRLLADATAQEKAVLGAIPYAVNETVLHIDERLLPPDPSLRASWNVRTDCSGAQHDQVMISYSLNQLQALDTRVDYIATLNPGGRVREDRVLARMRYEHPVHTAASVRARTRLPELDGPRLAFAGAYHGWAFHEDGCASGARAAARLGSGWV